MKKILLAVVLFALLAVPAFAGDNQNKNTDVNNDVTATSTSTSGSSSKSSSSSSSNSSSSSTSNSSSVSGSSSVAISGDSSATVGDVTTGDMKSDVSTSVNINNPRQFIQTPSIPEQYVPILPGGLHDITMAIPEFTWCPRLRPGERVVEFAVEEGSWLNLIRMGELFDKMYKTQSNLREGKWKDYPNKIRCQVLRGDANTGIGASSGASAGASTMHGGSALSGGLLGLLGINTSVADPYHIWYRFCQEI